VKLLGSQNTYTVISPVTKDYISLSRNLTEEKKDSMIMKILPPIFVENGGIPLSGLCTVQNGERSIYVTTDLRIDIGKGDYIGVDTFRAAVLDVGPSKIELDRAWELESASGLVLYVYCSRVKPENSFLFYFSLSLSSLYSDLPAFTHPPTSHTGTKWNHQDQQMISWVFKEDWLIVIPCIAWL